MKKNLLRNSKLIMQGCFALFTITGIANAQVGVGTKAPDASAILDVFASDKGLLFPRVGLQGVDDAGTIIKPAIGLTVWNTNLDMKEGNGIGLYSNFGTEDVPKWLKLVNSQDGVGGAGWLLTGNMVDATHYLGTNNAFPLVIKTNAVEAIKVDQNQLVGIGIQPMIGTRVNINGRVNTDSSYNIDGGRFVWNGGFNNKRNTILGLSAIVGGLTGTNNTFTGALVGTSTSSGSNNTFSGSTSGQNNTTGASNTFVGFAAGINNTTGSSNTYIGANTGSTNPAITNSTAIGIGAKTNATNNIQLGNNSARVSIGPNPNGAGATLDVDGTTIIGPNGSVIKNVIKAIGQLSFPPQIEGGAHFDSFINVPNAVVGSAVHVSPSVDIFPGIVISYARVSAPGVVKIRLMNITQAVIFPMGGGGEGGQVSATIVVIE